MKKILSFVLVLSLVLGSFSMAFAATPAKSGLSDVKGIANEDAIQVAYDLGIVTGNPDGTYLPAKAVTRAEFAAMITRALAIPDSALTAKTSKFKDTTGYGWAVPYLAFCESKGIMLGDGNGNVMPGRTINTNEAVTMVLRAVGYTANSAELVGVWPSNYVTKAQDLNIYDDVAKVVNVDKANAAQITYNTLTVQKVSVNSDGATTKLWDDSKNEVKTTLLTAGLDCKAVEDAVLGADYTYDDSKINIVPNLGAYGTAYIQKSGDKDVVAFTKDSTALTGSMDGNKFEADDVEYTMPTGWTASTTFTAIQNGKEVTATTFGGLDTDNGDITINVDLSGKTIKEIYSIVGWEATDGDTVSAADLKAIADNELLTGDLPEDDDDAIDTNGFELVGAKSLSDIKADNVVYIYEDENNGTIRKVAVGTEKVTGEVSEVNAKDSEITVNGKVYSFYDHSVGGSVYDNNLPEAGDKVDVTLDAYGYVYDFDATGSADTFAVVKGFDAGTNNVDDTRAKLYTSADATKTLTLVDVDDMSFDKVKTATTSGMTATNLTEGALIGYGLNKDGDIETLNLNVVSVGAAYLQTAKVVVAGGKSLPIDNDVVVFTKKDGEATYDITNIKNVKLGAANSLTVDGTFQYILDKDGDYVVAMLINDGVDGKDNDDLYAVVNSLTSKANADGDTVQRVTGFANGTALDKLTVDKNKIATLGTTVAAYKFTLNADGEINGGYNPISSTTVGAIEDINSDNTAVKIGGEWYSLADKAVVYKATTKDSDTKVDEYELSSATSMRAATNYVAYLFDLDTDEDHEGSELVIFVKY